MKTSNCLRVVAFAVATQFQTFATTITYASRSEFDARVGPASLVDFESENPNASSTHISDFGFGAALTFGNALFISSEVKQTFIFGKEINSTHGLTSTYFFNWGATAPLTVVFNAPVYSVALDLGLIWSGTIFIDAVGSTSTYHFAVDVPQSYNTTEPLTFFGFSSDTPIVEMRIGDPNGALLLDNLASSPTPLAVPDTGNTLTMFAAGVIALTQLFRSRLLTVPAKLG